MSRSNVVAVTTSLSGMVFISSRRARHVKLVGGGRTCGVTSSAARRQLQSLSFVVQNMERDLNEINARLWALEQNAKETSSSLWTMVVCASVVVGLFLIVPRDIIVTLPAPVPAV